MSSLTAFAGAIPQNYETYLGPLFFEPYALDLAERLKDGAYKSILELACGTGRVTKYLANKLAPGGRLSATDLNDGMLKIAKEQVQDNRIEWAVADAHDLPFADAQFDLVVCQYGVMFFTDKPKAMQEVLRVLKLGGFFVFNTWDKLQNNAVADAARQTMEEIFPDDPPAFLQKGPYAFFDTVAIRLLLERAGFVNIGIERIAKTSVAASADDVLKGFLDGTTLNPFLQERSDKEPVVRQRFRELLVQRYGETNLQLPMQAFVCTAASPSPSGGGA